MSSLDTGKSFISISDSVVIIILNHYIFIIRNTDVTFDSYHYFEDCCHLLFSTVVVNNWQIAILLNFLNNDIFKYWTILVSISKDTKNSTEECFFPEKIQSSLFFLNNYWHLKDIFRNSNEAKTMNATKLLHYSWLQAKFSSPQPVQNWHIM